MQKGLDLANVTENSSQMPTKRNYKLKRATVAAIEVRFCNNRIIIPSNSKRKFFPKKFVMDSIALLRLVPLRKMYTLIQI